MTIGKRLKEIKKELKITSKELADELGIPVRTIGSYERNEAQPGPKFFNNIHEKYNININWFLTGKGNMFVSEKTSADIGYIANLQERLNLSESEIDGLIDLLDSEASREMVFKFIEIKRGNKEALDSLIYNLQGIKAIYS
ncbi:helix-turn-helix domain-containing protein [bacterium]|nr:helix-turn-helix domain-containing protein [bacterium]